MKPFNELINQSAQRAMQDDRRIRKVIAQIVPGEILAHIQFCRIDNQVVSVTVDSANWVARLRFSTAQILSNLNAANINASSVSWHVTPSKSAVEPRQSAFRKRTRSEAAAQIVASTAAEMEQDELQAALLKVAAQLAKRPKNL